MNHASWDGEIHHDPKMTGKLEVESGMAEANNEIISKLAELQYSHLT